MYSQMYVKQCFERDQCTTLQCIVWLLYAFSCMCRRTHYVQAAVTIYVTQNVVAAELAQMENSYSRSA